MMSFYFPQKNRDFCIGFLFNITKFAPDLQSRVCKSPIFICMRNYIRHRGIIEKIEKHKVFVKIEQKTACSACHARSACLSSDKKEKIIEVSDTSGTYGINEDVIVQAHSSIGVLSVFIAFTIPLFLIIASLILGTKISGNEGIGGLAGLFVLIPYYWVLYTFRDKLKKKIVFTLSKVPDTFIKDITIETSHEQIFLTHEHDYPGEFHVTNKNQIINT